MNLDMNMLFIFVQTTLYLILYSYCVSLREAILLHLKVHYVCKYQFQ